jgi:hypothetical protein
MIDVVLIHSSSVSCAIFICDNSLREYVFQG